MKKQLTTIAILSSFSLLLSACGGSSSSSSETDSKANGFWVGESVHDGISTDTAAILYNGEIFVVDNPREIFAISDAFYQERICYSGNYLISDNNLSATYTSVDGISTTASLLLDGKGALEGSYSSNNNSNGTLSFVYNDLYDTMPSNQSDLNGTWELGYSTYSLYSETSSLYDSELYTTITISIDGTVTGTNGKGCIFNGSIITPDTAHPIYLVDIDVSNCGTDNGKLKGFGLTDAREIGQADEINIYATMNEEPSIWRFYYQSQDSSSSTSADVISAAN